MNNGSKPLPYEFVSLYLRGKSDGFTLKGGDATKGTLDVQYDGPRPDPEIAGTCGKTGTYQPMRKKGRHLAPNDAQVTNIGLTMRY